MNLIHTHHANTRAIKQALIDIELKGGHRRQIHDWLDRNDDIAEELADVETLEGQRRVMGVFLGERDED